MLLLLDSRHPPHFRRDLPRYHHGGPRRLSAAVQEGRGERAEEVEEAQGEGGLKQEKVIINSFSKYYSMTGWRLGWIVCQDPQLAQSFENLLQNFFISAPTLSQLAGDPSSLLLLPLTDVLMTRLLLLLLASSTLFAGIAAFDCIDELEQHVERYKKNREVLPPP